ENGNKDAIFNLAVCYRNGEGTEKNLEKAFNWYQKAAENENEKAMFTLANCYYFGEGIEKNLEKSFYWNQKAAENGNEDAVFNLAIYYYNGKGTEKNLNKAFYWYQKAAENGNVNAMYILAVLFENGVETEKNLEKTFHWYQKAAENGFNYAMYNLAICYKDGRGTEKNLEKAFRCYQKAADNGFNCEMHNVVICYENGKGTEKNLEKAFHLHQKAAKNDVKGAMYSLAICYENGNGIENNLEEAFHLYQKAVENGDERAMYNLVLYYKNGKETEKKLEKIFYWHQKVAESIKVSSKDEVGLLCDKCKRPYRDHYSIYQHCGECRLPCIDYQWCQQCNIKRLHRDFSKWTSKNEFIDKFIQEAQLNAKNCYEILEWIPYNKLLNISYYDKGGFSEIHKAIWSDGPIFSWNYDKQQWNRQTNYEVIIKTFDNSSSLNSKFLDEWKYHYNCQKKSFSRFIQIFGITQDPNNLNYIIVMSYAKKGSLRKCLSDIVKFKWQDKLQLLKKIILGLKVIHESNLTHGDFHDGNILMSDIYNELFITDLGLCKPISDSDNTRTNGNYGVLPYMAPEILRNKSYTPASDIYSFSMIMWEFTSGIPPFNDRAHDHHLILSVCEDERPKIIENTPKCYVDLMKKCWDSNSSNRPTIIMLENIISGWIKYVNGYYERNTDRNCCIFIVPAGIDDQLKNDMFEFVNANKALVQEQANTSIVQSHSQACYTSRKLTEILIQENSECFECLIEE
ncbi:kinase-like domain-containing protein, partial [Rhizophagus irregularis DAOM 181602=DAOM 197198]